MEWDEFDSIKIGFHSICRTLSVFSANWYNTLLRPNNFTTLVNECYKLRLLQLKYSLYDLFFNMSNPDYVQDNHWLFQIDPPTLSNNKALNTNKSEFNLSYIALVINDLA